MNIPVVTPIAHRTSVVVFGFRKISPFPISSTPNFMRTESVAFIVKFGTVMVVLSRPTHETCVKSVARPHTQMVSVEPTMAHWPFSPVGCALRSAAGSAYHPSAPLAISCAWSAQSCASSALCAASAADPAACAALAAACVAAVCVAWALPGAASITVRLSWISWIACWFCCTISPYCSAVAALWAASATDCCTLPMLRSASSSSGPVRSLW